MLRRKREKNFTVRLLTPFFVHVLIFIESKLATRKYKWEKQKSDFYCQSRHSLYHSSNLSTFIPRKVSRETMSLRGNTTATYFIFSTIVILSFFGNLMVLGVMLMKRGAFKKAYNIFIFSLACTDVITAIFLIFSRYLYLPDMPANKISATLFCSTIWNACILFGLGYVSIYTCLVLAIERWLAIVKPNIYRKTKPSQAVIIVGFVWFWGLLIQATTLFRAKPDFEKGMPIFV